jgi:GNAT superfamily N-acetyltransferase
MCEEWMTGLQLPLTPEQFRRLPRNPAYRYTHHAGMAWVNPRPRYYHALLDLTAVAEAPAPADFELRPVGEDDWEALAPAFADAFAWQPPFGGLDDSDRLAAARKSLAHTRRGGDGPWIAHASFLAPDEDGAVAGGVLVTLLPDRDPAAWGSYHWDEPPPEDALERRAGRPHLTWVFVVPGLAGRGLGTALLAAAAGALRGLGYQELASTFMLGNDSSMLWHWRNGFRLVSYPGSARRRGLADTADG